MQQGATVAAGLFVELNTKWNAWTHANELETLFINQPAAAVNVNVNAANFHLVGELQCVILTSVEALNLQSGEQVRKEMKTAVVINCQSLLCWVINLLLELDW